MTTFKLSPVIRDALETIYARLMNHYGPTHWWPGDTPFEIAVGAVLTQNTAWTNVEKAISNLKQRDLLDPVRILACGEDALHDALRPSGFFRIKATRLRCFCAYLVEQHSGSMETMAALPLARLRKELLAINGIGPETADDILLYACDKTVFVIDAYTRRILSRHGLCHADVEYETLRAVFERHLQPDLAKFQEYHGLLVYTGKDFCRRNPKCESCPLGALPKYHELDR